MRVQGTDERGMRRRRRRSPWGDGDGVVRSVVGIRRGDSNPFTGWAEGKGSRGRHVHVELWGELQGPQLLHLLLQPPVLLSQILTQPLQKLTVHLCLLQLCPVFKFFKGSVRDHNKQQYFSFLLSFTPQHYKGKIQKNTHTLLCGSGTKLPLVLDGDSIA